MKKEDLKYGNVVELRNGNRYLVIQNIQNSGMKFKNIYDGIYEISINQFDNEFKCTSNIDYYNKFDIMKVYKDYTLKELLWERKEKPKLTDDEKAILRNVDKKYKYIARDKNNLLGLYKQKPIKKYEYFWACKNENTVAAFEMYNHLFTFIKWEDEEPYLIEDLLKGE